MTLVSKDFVNLRKLSVMETLLIRKENGKQFVVKMHKYELSGSDFEFELN